MANTVPARLSRAQCLICRERFRKPQLVEHLAACPRWTTGPRRWVFLLFEGVPASRNWFFLAAVATATLHDVDRFVRDTVLGSLPIAGVSSFRRVVRRRRGDPAGKPDLLILGLDVRLDSLIEPDLKVKYDLGDSEPPFEMRALVERKGPAGASNVELVTRHSRA